MKLTTIKSIAAAAMVALGLFGAGSASAGETLGGTLPGLDMGIRIRGTSSLSSSSSPLIIIDGMEYPSGAEMKELDPSDIASIDVLKDAAATSIYGARGGNGVILVTTGNPTAGTGPLYIVDGVVMGDISGLDPSDIESIDVLKDAASSAIYGSRAANGVIIITTKCASGYGRGLRRHKPYLYEIWYDDYEDSDLTGDVAPFGDLPVQGMGGCSSVRVGNFHGRNLDIGVSDLATVVIHVKAGEGRFASVGTTQWFDVSETALSTNGVSTHRFNVLPNWMLDGINEKGVAINVNIIPMDVPQDGDDPGSDTRPALHARKVARYVLDHAESATGVIEDLKKLRIHGNIGAAENNIHWMISDAKKTFVVEIIKGEVVAREHPIMTNFNINWDNGNQRAIDPSEYENWGPEKYFWAAAYSNDTDTIFKTYTLHAEGIERYIRLRDSGAGYRERGKTLAGMVDLMRETQYSKIAYLPLAETYLSDLLDMQEVRDAGFGSLEAIYAASNAVKLAEMWEWLRPKMTNVYENLAKYRNPETIVPYSITTHNVTFDLAQKMFRIVVQEEYNEPFDFWLSPQLKITLTKAQQRYPWNGTVDFCYEVENTESAPANWSYKLAASLTVDGVTKAVTNDMPMPLVAGSVTNKIDATALFGTSVTNDYMNVPNATLRLDLLEEPPVE